MPVFHRCTTYGGKKGKGILPVYLCSQKQVQGMMIKHSTALPLPQGARQVQGNKNHTRGVAKRDVLFALNTSWVTGSPRDWLRTPHCLQDFQMLFGAWQAPDFHLLKYQLLCRDSLLQQSQRGITGSPEWHNPTGRHRWKPFKPFLIINTYALFLYEAQADTMLATDFLDSRKPNMFCTTYTSVQKLLEAGVASFRASFIWTHGSTKQ